jgi:hypothetical protein
MLLSIVQVAGGLLMLLRDSQVTTSPLQPSLAVVLSLCGGLGLLSALRQSERLAAAFMLTHLAFLALQLVHGVLTILRIREECAIFADALSGPSREQLRAECEQPPIVMQALLTTVTLGVGLFLWR